MDRVPRHHDEFPGKRIGFNTYRCTAPWCWARYSPERWWHRALGLIGRNPFDVKKWKATRS